MKRKRTTPSAPDQALPLDAVTGGFFDATFAGFKYNDRPVDSTASFSDDGVAVSVNNGGSTLTIPMKYLR